MTYYVPGLGEKDTDKTIRSLMQAHEKTAANETDIATNTADIATNAADIAALQAAIAGPPWGTGTVTSVGSGAGLTGGPITGSGSLAVDLSKLTNSLTGDVSLNDTANYKPGPRVAQGTTGVWFAWGTVTCADSAGAAAFDGKLWDGTTVIASTRQTSAAAGFGTSLSLCGYFSSPADDIRFDVKGASSTNGLIKFNMTGNSKDSTLSVVRIA